MSTTKTAHSVTEALAKFTLVAGAGSEEESTACAMTLLSWISKCAHPLIARMVIRANDDPGTTPAMRKQLARRGVMGALDTWWVPDPVVAWALSGGGATYDRAIRMLNRVAAWKRTKHRVDLRGVDLGGAFLSVVNLAKADMGGACLRSTILSAAVLHGAVLSEVDARESILDGADMDAAFLYRADLSSASLRDANLRHAVLHGANVAGADLRWATLCKAELVGVHMSGARLVGADLRDADVRPASLDGVDLTGAVGAPLKMPAGWRLDEQGVWVADTGGARR